MYKNLNEIQKIQRNTLGVQCNNSETKHIYALVLMLQPLFIYNILADLFGVARDHRFFETNWKYLKSPFIRK